MQFRDFEIAVLKDPFVNAFVHNWVQSFTIALQYILYISYIVVGRGQLGGPLA